MDQFDVGKRISKAKDLLDHVLRGDVDYIKTVAHDVLLKARYKDGNTVLLIATQEGNLNLCKEILKKCPSLLYQVNDDNKTVLYEAEDLLKFNTGPVKTGQVETFQFIDFFVSTGLDQIATSNELRDTVKLEFERWMRMQTSRGNAALLKAARHSNLHVVKRFVEVDRQYNLGLSNFVGYDGKTALMWAMENEDHEMLKLLFDKADPYSDFVPYSTAMDLFSRVRTGDLDYIKTVELNVLLNSRDQKRNSVLFIATAYNRLDCCKEILKRCPSLLYHQNNYKWSVLHYAAYRKNYRLIEFFVSAGLEAAKSESGTENMIRFEKWINLQTSGFGDTKLISAVINHIHGIVHQYNMMALQTGNSCGTVVATKSNIFTFVEVSKHNNLNNKVYDVTNFWGNHPGGNEVLLKATGKDANTDFKKAHSHSSNALTMMDKFDVGVCDSKHSITSALIQVARDKPQPYSRVQLEAFTNDFSQHLGSGSFGDVFKGQLPNEVPVFIAVKVLKNFEFKEEVMEEQFVAEIITMGRAYHRNLIKLYGFCYEPNTKFKALVYDYMENGSFDRILFEKKLDIPWGKLHDIAKEIAHGISYLHESCYPQIIHQDIKPSNVLLDSKFSPKVIDFGLAKVNMGESQFDQTKIKGSRNYMAPEVNQLEQVKLSCKLDVYSFGMMLFDILGSKRNHVEKSWFPSQVWGKYKIDQLDEFILESGIKKKDKESAKRLAIIALLCVEHNPQDRPMLSNVVKMLEGKISLDTPVAPFYPNYSSSSESSSMSDSRDY